MENISVLEQATKSNYKPSSDAVVAVLLEAEKTAKKNKVCYSFAQLIGNWQLCWITGTKKSQQKAGIVLGTGRYIPQWIAKIQIAYSAAESVAEGEENSQFGRVKNSVKVGSIELTLSGPTKFLPNNILAFDFTRITVKLLGKTVYQGYIRGGESRETEFFSQSVGKQAFFTYFLVEDGMIAARGRGGGLALWGKI